MINPKELRKKLDKELFADLKGYFKFVNRCKKCNVLYGVDIITDNSLCPNHTPSNNNWTKRKTKSRKKKL